MIAIVALEKIAASKISASHQILFIELMSILRQTRLEVFLGIAQTPFKEIATGILNISIEFNH